MKNSFYGIFLLILFTQISFSLTRGDVQIIEARENIQYLGQKISTDYFLLYTRPYDLVLQNKFKENIAELEININNITNTTKNPVTMTILKFYRYRLEYIQAIPLENPTLRSAKFILNASENFLEGARSIAEQHRYQSSKEEEMLVLCKELQYLVESVSKYYMAFQIGLIEQKDDLRIKNAIKEINQNLKNIEKYNYNQELKTKLLEIKNIWEHNKSFFENLEETTFPNLLLSSNAQIKELLIELEKYHKQHL